MVLAMHVKVYRCKRKCKCKRRQCTSHVQIGLLDNRDFRPREKTAQRDHQQGCSAAARDPHWGCWATCRGARFGTLETMADGNQHAVLGNSPQPSDTRDTNIKDMFHVLSHRLGPSVSFQQQNSYSQKPDSPANQPSVLPSSVMCWKPPSGDCTHLARPPPVLSEVVT